MKLSKILMLTAVGALAFTTAAAYAGEGLVWRADADQDLAALDHDGDAVKAQLSRPSGYTVDLQYAQDDIANQLSQPEKRDHRGRRP